MILPLDKPNWSMVAHHCRTPSFKRNSCLKLAATHPSTAETTMSLVSKYSWQTMTICLFLKKICLGYYSNIHSSWTPYVHLPELHTLPPRYVVALPPLVESQAIDPAPKLPNVPLKPMDPLKPSDVLSKDVICYSNASVHWGIYSKCAWSLHDCGWVGNDMNHVGKNGFRWNFGPGMIWILHASFCLRGWICLKHNSCNKHQMLGNSWGKSILLFFEFRVEGVEKEIDWIGWSAVVISNTIRIKFAMENPHFPNVAQDCEDMAMAQPH